MRSTCARATGVGLVPSNTSQSPTQKSNCRYSAATQEEAGAGDSDSWGCAAIKAGHAGRKRTPETLAQIHRLIEITIVHLAVFIGRKLLFLWKRTLFLVL